MIRKSNSKCHKKSRATDEKSNTQSITDSVHEKNLYVVSFPLIFVFNILRSALYLFYVIFRYIWKSTSKVFILRSVNLGLHTKYNRNNCEERQQNLISTNIVEIPTEGLCEEYTEMSYHKTRHTSSPGSIDPLLAKQKDHHRKAFEFISKALKIDEENEGELDFYILNNSLRFHRINF